MWFIEKKLQKGLQHKKLAELEIPGIKVSETLLPRILIICAPAEAAAYKEGGAVMAGGKAIIDALIVSWLFLHSDPK